MYTGRDNEQKILHL